MTEEQIKEAILIETFLGSEIEEDHGRHYIKSIIGGEVSYRNIDRSGYHKSWDDLINVCKKCSEICETQERPTKNHCNRLDFIETDMRLYLGLYDMKKTYDKVIEFIKLYKGW